MTEAIQGHPTIVIAPLAWLVLLVALYFSSDRRAEGLRRGGFHGPKREGARLRHRVFGLLGCAKIVAAIATLQLSASLLHSRVAAAGEVGVRWLVFGVVVACSYRIAAEIVRNALEPMPALSGPALMLVRWLGSLVLSVVVLAGLPMLAGKHLGVWLQEARLSCSITVFALEAGLLVALLTHLRELGLFVRSRSVGLAFGLAALGMADTSGSLGGLLPGTASTLATTMSNGVVVAVVAVWSFYIVAADRERLPHALNPRGLLMTWRELASQLASNMQPAQSMPFIAGIEARVQSILAKYGVQSGIQ